MAPQKEEKQQIRHVFIQEFLKDDQGQVFGVQGVTWPERRPVSVVMDNECDKAKNENRPTFAKFSKGFRAGGNKVKLEEGAIIRVRTLHADENPCSPGILPLKTDWINVVTYNRQQTMERVKFGLVQGKVSTPPEVWEKREQIRTSPDFKKWMGMQEDKAGRRLSPREINGELERRLSEEMPGKNRYNARYFLYYPEGITTSSDRGFLRSELQKYFSDPAFDIQESDGGNQYRPVRPHLIIRGLNENGEYTGRRAEFMPKDAEEIPIGKDGKPNYNKRRFKTPGECVADIMANLPPDCASYSILPAKVYTHSPLAMEMGVAKENNYAQKAVGDLNFACHIRDGEKVKGMAIPMGLKFSSDDERPVVTEMMRDYRLERVDPVMVERVEKSAKPGEFDKIVRFRLAPELEQKLENGNVMPEEEDDAFAPSQC